MKTLVCIVASTFLILSTSGCATSSCGTSTCNSGGGGIFGFGLLPDSFSLPGQPIRSLFRGAPCDTCNTPAGQTNYNPNVAPLCNGGSCGGFNQPGNMQAPGQIQLTDPGVQYYDGNNALPQIAPQTGIPTPAVTEGSSSRIPYSLNNVPTIDGDLLPPSM